MAKPSTPQQEKIQSALRDLPSVEKVLQELEGQADHGVPRPVVADLVRDELAAIRSEILSDPDSTPSLDAKQLQARLTRTVHHFGSTRLQPVLNATGVLIHTNLGRSPLGARQADALRNLATHYNNLEFDLETGGRGARAGYVERLLATLCEAESATMVNNCASALVLVLRCLAADPEKNEVIVSRGELVEIGGGFRIPDIMAASGARLVEIGTTNKTNLADYENAITERTALFMKIHRSNFYIEGFTASPSVEELGALAERTGVPFFEDLGSGAMMQTDQLAPIEHEPTPIEQLRRGTQLVCFSGDKLLGGPQTGIIAGRADLVKRIKKEPFFRAVRCDKLILGVLQETVSSYLNAKGQSDPRPEVPVIEMMQISQDDLRTRTEAVAAKIAQASCLEVEVVEGVARVGGGTMPKSEIPSIKIVLQHPNLKATDMARILREGRPALVGQIEDERLQLDLRTIFAEQESTLLDALSEAFG